MKYEEHKLEIIGFSEKDAYVFAAGSGEPIGGEVVDKNSVGYSDS